jgi:glycosyltransferase involved in cell wall biosynthesis
MLGAKNVVLAPNGIAHNKSRALPNKIVKIKHTEQSFIFIGSAHQPNWIGFEAMVGFALGFLPVTSKIYLIGGVSDHFVKTLSKRTIEHVTFWQRAVGYGRVSQSRLDKLIQGADVILLPITEGGGSNLKTAEAFAANKKIIATDYAMRSYEYLEHMPNLRVVSTPQAFRAAMISALDEPLRQRSSEEQVLVDRVYWENSLKELVKEASLL